MLIFFHSFPFIAFFLIVFVVYWSIPKHKALRNSILLLASYIFYASWNYKFLSLLLTSTLVDYFCAQIIFKSSSQTRKKVFLWISISVNLGLLATFKYFNFFIDNLRSAAEALGLSLSINNLEILLPIGISFYTFQTISYTVEVYKGRLQPITHFPTFALYVSYFPQLIAGPIEKAKSLMPQLETVKKFADVDFKRGLYLFVIGFIKKVAVADTLNPIVSAGFENSGPLSSLDTLVLSYLFYLQIYCDFSGYSNMARGISEFFGIRLSQNFNLPIFAKNPSDFWNRWHITLSDWVKVYLFVPLLVKLRNPYLVSLICFPLMGLWHGAKWTFVLWGFYWLLATVIVNLIKGSTTRKIPDFVKVVLTLHVASIGLLLFRSDSFVQWLDFLKNFVTGNLTFNLIASPLALSGVVLFLVYELYLHFRNDYCYPANWGLLKMAAFYFGCLVYYRVYSGTAIMDYYYLQF